MDTKALKKQMGAAIAMVLVAAVALGSATFAWFVNNTKVTAETADLTAKTANTLLISEHDQNNWKTLLPLNATLNELVPVSTVGSNGTDLTFVKNTTWTTDSTNNMSYATGFETATAGTDYYSTEFDIKGSVAGSSLYLDSETDFDFGSYSEDVLKSLRLGLVVDGKTYVYQIQDGNLSSAYNTSINSTSDADGISKAIDSTGAVKDIAVNNASGTVGVLPKATAPTGQTDFVTATNGADKLYTFTNSGDVVDVKAYIWMEGCDYDCNNAVVASITGQKVLAKLGFAVANAA